MKEEGWGTHRQDAWCPQGTKTCAAGCVFCGVNGGGIDMEMLTSDLHMKQNSKVEGFSVSFAFASLSAIWSSLARSKEVVSGSVFERVCYLGFA